MVSANTLEGMLLAVLPIRPAHWVPAHRVQSVSDYVEYVMDWKRQGRRPVAFCGERFTGWRAQPKVFRPHVGIYKHEKSAVRDLIAWRIPARGRVVEVK